MSKTRATSARTETQTPDGRAIIAREHGVLTPHPHPTQGGRLVSTRGVNKILVADPGDAENGDELYECDMCGKVDEDPLSIRGHLSAHNPSRKMPDYDPTVLRRVIETATKYREAKVRGYAERTASELNALGVKTFRGGPWTANTVSSIYNHWKDHPDFRRRRTVTRKPRTSARGTAATPAATATPVTERPQREVSPRRKVTVSVDARPQYLYDELRAAARQIEHLASVVDGIADVVATLPIVDDVSDELRAKAAKYDQLLGMLK